MKIYNIKDTNRFFKKLANCNDEVEIVNDEGLHISLLDNDHRGLDIISASYAKGKIDEIELIFIDPRDQVMIMEYLAAM